MPLEQTHSLSLLCVFLSCRVATLRLVCPTFDLCSYPERRGTLTSAGYGQRTQPVPLCHITTKIEGTNKQQTQARGVSLLTTPEGATEGENGPLVVTRGGQRVREKSVRGEERGKKTRKKKKRKPEEKVKQQPLLSDTSANS